jgi:hypothetical protein
MTATPGTTAKAPVTATSNYSGGQQTATPTLKAPPASAPTVPQANPAPSPGQPTYNTPTATVPATNTVMPSNMSATGTPPTTSPSLGTVLPLLPASKVGLKAAPARKANIGGAIANALMKHNANSAGVGFLLPNDPDTEVYVDRTGKVTVGGKPYDAKNPEHQQAAGIITIGGQPYDPNNAQHRAAYLAFKDTAGRGGTNQVKIDKDGKVTVFGQPFDPSNPSHIMAYNQHILGSSVHTTPPAQQRPPAQRPPSPPPAQQTPAASLPDVVQALSNMGYSKQQAAALAAKVPQGTSTADAVKQILQGKITESLTWSRSFDPGLTLLKKMKSR